MSKSPELFSRILKKVGIKGTYVPFKVNHGRIGQAVKSLCALNMAGANVSAPYTESVMSHLDILSEGANIIGAVNTIVRNGSELKGYNTNAIGIMDALGQAGFEPEGKSALVFGTGGAAKATAFILNWLRTETIYVTGRNEPKAMDIVERFGGQLLPLSSLTEKIPPVDIVVNATSVSSASESPEFAAHIESLKFPSCELVLDMNYGRMNNFWQKMAHENGVTFMDGLSPLAYQARRTFSLWTGLQVPAEDFLKALSKA